MPFTLSTICLDLGPDNQNSYHKSKSKKWMMMTGRKKLSGRIWAEPVWEGLNRVWGVIRGLQRRDNQQGFILTFEVVVVVCIFPFQRQCDDPPLTIWIGQQSCCPAQGRRLLDPTCALAQPWPCWLLNFLSQRVTHLEHISPLLLKQDPDCPYCLTQLRTQLVLYIILCIHVVFLNGPKNSLMLLTLFLTPNSHCYLRRIQKWGKSWACHNWNKWLICQILPNYPTGIWSSKSVHTFIVNFSTKVTGFEIRKTKQIEADAMLIWFFIPNIISSLAEVWVLDIDILRACLR